MAITTLTAASTRRLTSVEALIQDIGADGLGNDLLLVRSLIDQVSRAIEQFCGRIFAQQEYQETLAMQRDQILGLRYSPLVVVSDVTLDTTVITDYRIENVEAGLVFRRAGWWQASVDPDVWVVYTAGYILPEQVNPVDNGPGLPPDIERAAIETIKIWQFERLPADRIVSRTFGLTGDSVSYRISANKGSIPPLAMALLAPYKRMSIR